MQELRRLSAKYDTLAGRDDSLTFENTSTYNESTWEMTHSAMHINVAQLLKEPVGASRTYEMDETLGQESIGRIKGKISLIRTNRSILVRGTMSANVAGACSRCLRPLKLTVDFGPEEEFFPRLDSTSSSDLAEECDSSTSIDDDNMLDLSELMRQYSLLRMPIKPLCHPDCGGLCASCGHDLNQGPCRCSLQSRDRRWSKLVRLREENKI